MILQPRSAHHRPMSGMNPALSHVPAIYLSGRLPYFPDPPAAAW
jgi:hypothetical protein